MIITPEIAKNIRCERGLSLPVSGVYSVPRLKEIAIRQKELLDELAKLDAEVIKLSN